MTKAESKKERIIAIDALRGFALLGILLMNIQSFANVDAGYFNPVVVANTVGLNKIIWIIVHVIADQKFMTIFSILFGAGIVLFSENLERKGINPTAIFYKRTFWLIIFGLIHAYMLWHGDILVSYGLSALVVYWARKWPVKKLLISSFITLAVLSLAMFASSLDTPSTAEIQEMEQAWFPTQEMINAEVESFRGNWLEQMPYRSKSSFEVQSAIIFIFWRVGGLMLLGMALFKIGVLTAKHTSKFYIKLASISFGIGFSMVLIGVYLNFDNNWDRAFSAHFGNQWNYWGSIAVACGYIGAIMLLSKNKSFTRLTKALAAIGRTAFSNYILQTLIGTFIFYGSGLGYFAKIDIAGQMIIVLFIWVFQIIISNIWLKYFNYGLLEWVWRGLTYGKFQTLRKN